MSRKAGKSGLIRDVIYSLTPAARPRNLRLNLALLKMWKLFVKPSGKFHNGYGYPPAHDWRWTIIGDSPPFFRKAFLKSFLVGESLVYWNAAASDDLTVRSQESAKSAVPEQSPCFTIG